MTMNLTETPRLLEAGSTHTVSLGPTKGPDARRVGFPVLCTIRSDVFLLFTLIRHEAYRNIHKMTTKKGQGEIYFLDHESMHFGSFISFKSHEETTSNVNRISCTR